MVGFKMNFDSSMISNIGWGALWKLFPLLLCSLSLIARFMGPTWGPSGADRIQVGPVLAPWTLLSEMICANDWMHYGLKVVSCFLALFPFRTPQYHHHISLSSLCWIIWKHWIHNIFVWYILSSVYLRLCSSSQWSFMQPAMGLSRWI